MNFSPDELAARLKAEGAAVIAFFQALPPAAWDLELYHDGGAWQVRDVLAHFIAAERGMQDLVEDVAAGGAGAGEDFNIDAYNRRTVSALRGQEPAVLLSQFAMVRERTAAITAALRPEQLENAGHHPYVGRSTLDEIIRAIYHHNSLHLRDLRAALRDQPERRLP
jgi:hypothetical protein